MEAFVAGVSLLLDPWTFVLVCAGVLVGVCVGALPGLSSPMAIALLIPMSASLAPIPAIAMMAALYCGASFGGSIPAILLNAPGAPPAVATAIDGYPMARRGESGRALGIALVSSVAGGLLSLGLFVWATPWLAGVAVRFGPADHFALAVFALSMLTFVGGRSPIRNLIAGSTGVLLGTVGTHLATGTERFTFGASALSEGVALVPVLIGLFAVAELLNRTGDMDAPREPTHTRTVRLPDTQELLAIRGTILRSSGIGALVGVLPAEGATVAAIMGYNQARRWSKHPELFGTGCAEGVAAAEAANNAAVGGALVPTLALGIPGSASTALMLTALVMHGFRPGPYLLEETPEVVYALFGAMILANLALLPIGLAVAALFSRVSRVPQPLVWSAVFALAVVGSYAASSSWGDVWLMLVCGLAGFFMLRHGFGPAPLVMGLILGGLVEDSFSQSMIIYAGDVLAPFGRPVVRVFSALTILTLLGPALATWRARQARRPTAIGGKSAAG